MKNNKLTNIFIFSSILFLLSFVFGYQLMHKKLNQKEISKSETNLVGPYEDIEIIKEENKISPNTFIEERIHYKTCDHIITEINPAEDEVINLDRKEYEEYLRTNYSNLRLISFSTTKIVVWEERNHLCKNHYVIGEEEGKIAIFKVDDNGDRILEKVFEDYPLTLLINIDQDKIKNGIIVDSEDELSEILENFIS